MPRKRGGLTLVQYNALYRAAYCLKYPYEDGCVPYDHIYSNTRDALRAKGLIAEDALVRTPEARTKITDDLNFYLARAQERLTNGGWQQALTCLQIAERLHHQLADRADWLTPDAYTLLKEARI